MMKKAVVLVAVLLLSASVCHAMENDTYSKEIAAAINDYLVSRDYTFAFNDTTGVFRFGFKIDGKMNKLDYQMRVRNNDYIVYATSAVSPDPDDKVTMLNMAEFICRANYGLRAGNFELDMTDGEIRYKNYIDCENRELTPQIVRYSIIIPAMMFERYSPGILDVIFMGSNAKDAISKCEQ